MVGATYLTIRMMIGGGGGGGGGGYFFVKPSVYKNDWRGWGGDGERHHVAERLVGATSPTIKMMIGGVGGGYLFVKPSVFYK